MSVPLRYGVGRGRRESSAANTMAMKSMPRPLPGRSDDGFGKLREPVWVGSGLQVVEQRVHCETHDQTSASSGLLGTDAAGPPPLAS